MERGMALRRLVMVICFAFFCLPVYAKEGFQPVSAEELKLTSVPEAPGAAAVVLYRQLDRDDSGHGRANEFNYFRIKILTEEGRKYADVEIPFLRQEGGDIVNIKARTIKPDGSIVPFDGKVYEKTISKAKGFRYLAKTFTLPDIQVGSIVEYYYTEDLPESYIYSSHWVLSNQLFIQHAKFSLKPYTSSYRHIYLQWSWQMLPAGTGQPKEGPDGIVRLEVNNIPAFRTEDYMPPPDQLKSRVDFAYSEEAFAKDPVEFWKNRGKKLNDMVESFVGKRQAMETAVAQIVSQNDPPEVKLQKIYVRVQQVRNISYEPRKSEEERKRENEKPAANVEEVWNRGYGTGTQLTWLFLGLARAAGLDAYALMVSERRNYFFNPRMMNARQLDANVVLVKLNGKDLFFDPGAAFTPYGMLMWPETGVQGLRLDKDGGTWIQTTVPESKESRIERRAAFTVSGTGDLEGKLTITFTGLEAMRRRVQERNEDDVARKKLLEEQAKESIPAASEVELKNQPTWNSSSTPLVAEFEVKIPGWGSPAGRRMLLPVGVFSAAEKHVFDHAERTNAIYFEYPCERADDITINLPEGWQVGSLPPEQNQSVSIIGYALKAENDKQTLHLTRTLRIDAVLIESKYYGSLRAFFQTVRKGDEQQIVLQPAAASSSN
jgi:hypothetical protein